MKITVSGQKVSWTPDPGLGADGYLVVVMTNRGYWVSGKVTGTSATMPSGTMLAGIRPTRGKRIGPLFQQGSGTTTSPLTRALPFLHHFPVLELRAPPRVRASSPFTMTAADVDLTPAAPGVSGVTTLTLVADGTSGVVPLYLLPGTATAVDGTGTSLAVTRSGNEIDVDLGSTPSAGATVTLTVIYTLDSATVDRSVAGRVADSTSDLFFFSAGAAIWPRLKTAVPGDAQVSFTLHLPQGWSAASGGPRHACADTCFDPPAFAPNIWPALAAASYQTATAPFTGGNVEALASTTAQGTPDPVADASFFADVLDVYAAWGAPARDNVSVAAVSPSNGGLSTYGLVLAPDTSLAGSLTPALRFFFAHELSHQWWGAVVYTVDPLDLWLKEGMADYSAIDALTKIDGAGTGSTLWQAEHDQLVDLMANGYGGQPGRDVPVRPSDPANLQDYVYYLKGALVLRHLSGVLGAAGMDATLTSYLGAHRHAGAATADFEAIAEGEAGTSLGWFWHEWLEGTGLPEVTTAVYVDPGNSDDVEVLVTQHGDTPFPGETWSLPLGVTVSGQTLWGCSNAATTDLVDPTGHDAAHACP